MSDEAALDLVKRSRHVGAMMESGRVQIDMVGKDSGQEISMSTDLSLARNGWMSGIIELETPEGKLKEEVIITDLDVYSKEDDGSWFRTDIEVIANRAGVSVESLTDPTAFGGPVFPREDIPWDLYTAHSLGKEKIDRVQTEHLRIDVDFAELWAALGPEARQETFQSLGPAQSLLRKDPAMKYEEIEVWIDDRNLTVKMVVSMSMGSDIKLGVEVRITDYSEDIQVNAPNDYEGGTRAEPEERAIIEATKRAIRDERLGAALDRQKAQHAIDVMMEEFGLVSIAPNTIADYIRAEGVDATDTFIGYYEGIERSEARDLYYALFPDGFSSHCYTWDASGQVLEQVEPGTGSCAATP